MNNYSILGIPNGSSKEEIKKAFRKLAHIHHPDKGGDAKKFSEINKAYLELMKDEPEKSSDNFWNQSSYQYKYKATYDDISKAYENVFKDSKTHEDWLKKMQKDLDDLNNQRKQSSYSYFNDQKTIAKIKILMNQIPHSQQTINGKVWYSF